jgi:hypothetical protein
MVDLRATPLAAPRVIASCNWKYSLSGKTLNDAQYRSNPSVLTELDTPQCSNEQLQQAWNPARGASSQAHQWLAPSSG